jgi:hypothetical protein
MNTANLARRLYLGFGVLIAGLIALTIVSTG